MILTHVKQPLADFLEANMPHYMALLKRLVDVNSFTANPEGVNENGALVAEAFAELGFSAESVPSINPLYGSHVVLTRRGRTDRRIGLVTHLDTVYPAIEEKLNDFHWRIEGDRIYGPGTVDIKGGTVMIYMVLDALRHVAPAVFEAYTWIVLANASEEVINHDFGDLCLDRLGPDALACLVFEGGIYRSGEFKIVTARKGMATYRIEVTGKGAHAGVAPERGANAIVQLAQTIQQIASFTDFGRKITFNVGTVAGGTVINRVPHHAVAHVEMRAFDVDVYDEGMAKMRALPQAASVVSLATGYPCTVAVEVLLTLPPWSPNAATDGLYAAWEAAGAALDYAVVAEQRGGLSDGNLIWQHIPTIDGMGPSGDNSHCSERTADGSKDQEYVDRASFVPKAILNVAAILQMTASVAEAVSAETFHS